MAEKIDSEEFWLSAPRYLKQAGQSEAQYVAATPPAPVKVVLPAKIVRKGETIDQPEDAHLKRARQERPKDVHPGVKASKPPPGHAAVTAQPQQGRAADK